MTKKLADHPSGSALPRAEPTGRARAAAGTLRRLAGLFDTADPRRFVRLLGLLCLLVLVAIVGLTSLAIDRVYRNAMVEQAEAAAVSVGQAIFANERENLLVRDSGGNEALHLPAERRRDFDVMMRNYVEPFRVLKIKIFSADKRVIYSTDPGLVGRRDTSPAIERE